eukprot:scaffold124909_cov57-Phaeocystis_antarctica.AAC.3
MAAHLLEPLHDEAGDEEAGHGEVGLEEDQGVGDEDEVDAQHEGDHVEVGEGYGLGQRVDHVAAVLPQREGLRLEGAEACAARALRIGGEVLRHLGRGLGVGVVLGHRLQRPALQQEGLEARVGGELLPLLRRSVVKVRVRVGARV